MSNAKVALFLGIVFILLFALFSLYIKRGGMKNMDFAVTVKLQERINKSSRLRTAEFIGNLMEGSTFFASPEFSVFIILVITFVTVINLKKKKIVWLGLIIPVLFCLLVLAEIYGKTVVHHPAPPFFMIKNPTTIFPKYYINEEFSYPSGHAARSMFISILIILITIWQSNNPAIRKRLALICGIACFIYLMLVSISRIYLGHHWLSDIIGGFLLGLGFGLMSIIIYRINVQPIKI